MSHNQFLTGSDVAAQARTRGEPLDAAAVERMNAVHQSSFWPSDTIEHQRWVQQRVAKTEQRLAGAPKPAEPFGGALHVIEGPVQAAAAPAVHPVRGLAALQELVTDSGNGPGNPCGPGSHPVPLGSQVNDHGRHVEHRFACSCSGAVHAAGTDADQLLAAARTEGRVSERDAKQYAVAYAGRPRELQAQLARLTPVPVQAAAAAPEDIDLNDLPAYLSVMTATERRAVEARRTVERGGFGGAR